MGKLVNSHVKQHQPKSSSGNTTIHKTNMHNSGYIGYGNDSEDNSSCLSSRMSKLNTPTSICINMNASIQKVRLVTRPTERC